ASSTPSSSDVAARTQLRRAALPRPLTALPCCSRGPSGPPPPWLLPGVYVRARAVTMLVRPGTAWLSTHPARRFPPTEPHRPLSLYVHLPWCVRKCPYCDFNSYQASGPVPEERYVDALLRDLEAERRFAGDRPIRSIFIGGGTPSLFSGDAVAQIG